MGTVAGVQYSQGAEDNVFVKRQLREFASTLASRPESREEFSKFIKDGLWVDDVVQMKLLQHRCNHPDQARFAVSFPEEKRGGGDNSPTLSGSLSSKSAKSSSPMRTLCSTFVELYGDSDASTCFSRETFAAFLFAILTPLHAKNAHSFEEQSHSVVSFGHESAVDLGAQKDEMTRLQSMLLGTAAYLDEVEVTALLSSSSWLHVVANAVQDCCLRVTVCEVHDASAGKNFTLVTTNIPARRFGSQQSSAKMRSGLSAEEMLSLWGADAAEPIKQSIARSLQSAQPMRLFSKAPAAETPGSPGGAAVTPRVASCTASVLDITHIFNEEGTHRYVLSMQMDCAGAIATEKELRCLQDSALVISHLIAAAEPHTGSEKSKIPAQRG
jgi:hypothetical protein